MRSMKYMLPEIVLTKSTIESYSRNILVRSNVKSYPTRHQFLQFLILFFSPKLHVYDILELNKPSPTHLT